MADDGFILLARRFFDHTYWNLPRKYSQAEAFIDCIAMASFKSRQVMLGTTRIELGRGEFAAAMRFLERRWGWGLRQVHDFIQGAIEAGELALVKETPKGNAYRLVNYDTYQTVGNAVRKRKCSKQETNSKVGKERKSPNGDLLRRACEAWSDRFGGTVPSARIVKALDPLFTKYGAEVLPVWLKYLEKKDAEYATAEDFAAKYGAWRDGKVKQQEKPQQFDYTNSTTQFKGFTK